MKIGLYFLTLLGSVNLFSQSIETYPTDIAGTEQPGVPKGEVIQKSFSQSKIYPGTTHDYWIYIPAQYKPDQPACVYINQDGIQWKAPTVFDNLIDKKEMPVTIAVFVSPGKVLPDSGLNAQARYNRSVEYDGLGDAYARFILTEILPEVEKQMTRDGRVIRLSKNGNDRAIGGARSGAIAAFSAAWEHPEEFSKVFSAIGTYTGLRGGDRYPTLIRKYEPKPIRIFMQDGANDLNNNFGDWWYANQMMERALQFSGYEVNHAWGTGAHNGSQGTSVFPEAMRWLWKGWPARVSKGRTANNFLSRLLIPGEEWELVGEGYTFTEGTSVNNKGQVVYVDIPESKMYAIGPDRKPLALAIDTKKASGVAYGSDNKRYTAAGGSRQILRYDENEKVTVIADSIAGNDLVVSYTGNIYVTVPDGALNPGKIYLVSKTGEKKIVDEGLKFPNGVSLSPDQTQLFVAESATHWVWAYSINKDGTLSNKQRYGWLHVPDNAENAWPDGIKCDTTGRIFVTSKLGIQVMDPLGRVNAIIPIPPSNGQASNLCFAGANFDMLYISAGNKVFRRKLNVRGANAFEKPVKPANPGM